jgi:AbrB family looped-hinge helix DNA binding protein
METTLDRFGRVVIPKKVRDDLDLRAGETLNIQEREDGIFISPLRKKSGLEYKKGILVITGGELTGDPADLVRKDREARMKKLWGTDRR